VIGWPWKRGTNEGARRVQVRRDRGSPLGQLRLVMSSRRLGYAVLIGAASAIVLGGLLGWARGQPLLPVGRLADETVVARASFRVDDPARTAQSRRLASDRAPHVLTPTPDMARVLEGLRELPSTLRDAGSLEAVAPEIRRQYALSEGELEALRPMAGEDGGPSPAWERAVRAVADGLRRRPLVSAQTWQNERQRSAQLGGSDAGEAAPLAVAPGPEGDAVRTTAASLVNVTSEPQRERMADAIAQQAGLEDGRLRSLIAGRLAGLTRPLFEHDEQQSRQRSAAAAGAVPEASIEVRRGQVLVRRGEPVGLETLGLVRAERRAAREQRPALASASAWLGAVGVAGLVVVVVGVYLGRHSERIARNPDRMLGVAGLFVAGFALSVWASTLEPRVLFLVAIAPTLLVGVLLAIAYEARIALAVGAAHAVLVMIALDRPAWFALVPIAGLAASAWRLGDIRDRRALVRTGVLAAGALAVACGFGGLVGRDASARGLLELSWDVGFAASAGVLTAGIVLFILPSVERAFDITTGMTLIELRDPKQPLLRELQRRAPGTYNHSMNVATIAEAAADAIGADALQTYVGALYHDIGKMNKPEYFVENQAGGPNKHDKLSPAMSLLVIVGHVKDGMELAREFDLPRSLHHYIESHHGTTLVEYFYHRAKQKAADEADAARESTRDASAEAREVGAARREAEPAPEPKEIEYRYPGPKPRTKECAILMLADAVESATRTMADPTPARIDQLVRQLARKRLMDGQFEDCELTLRELDLVGDSIAKTVASIYHGRIAYPGGGEKRA